MIDFVLRSLIELATLPGSVPKLRSFILDQAVRGNLTADRRRDHPEVEPASVLLERIREEKRELVKSGKIKKQKELPPVETEEVPFTVPETWEWVRLGDVIELVSGQHLKPGEYTETAKGIPYLTGPAEFGLVHPNPLRYNEVRRAVATAGDVLLTVKGAGVGKINVVTTDEIAISRQLMGSDRSVTFLRNLSTDFCVLPIAS